MVNKRQSDRKYKKTPVDRELVIKCLEAARLAPSACNSQPWKFVVVDNPELLSEMASAAAGMGMNKFTDQVPCFVVVSEGAYNPTAACGSKIKHQDFRSLDIGIAVAHFCLAAQAQGLATCILGWFDEKDLQRTLQIHHHIRVVIAVGIAAENDPHRPKKRKTLADIVDFR